MDSISFMLVIFGLCYNNPCLSHSCMTEYGYQTVFLKIMEERKKVADDDQFIDASSLFFLSCLILLFVMIEDIDHDIIYSYRFNFVLVP